MINKYMDEATETSKTLIGRRELAEQAAAERLLNAYFRETGVFDPTAEWRVDGEQELPAFLSEELQKQGDLLKLTLPLTGAVLLGAVRYLSTFGHHRYGRSFWVKKAGSADFTRIPGTAGLAALLLGELASATDATPEKKQQLVTNLLTQVNNSIDKTTIYIQDSERPSRDLSGSFLELDGVPRFYTAEQSLVYGHPFHPTPKSSQGFLPEDLEKYAPEMGASFALHYFACAVELVQESFLTAGQPEQTWFPAMVVEAAEERLGDGWQQQYRLIPCHPWQSAHLKTWPEVQQLMNQGLLIDLGPLGDRVYPTSSVRTVWDPQHTHFFKLPLHVRITHFIRVNPIDQCERTMDASRVLHHLNTNLNLNTNQQRYFDGFTILHEAGYRTIVPREMPEDTQARLSEAFGIILRENPAVTVSEEELPVVVAGLLEHQPHAEQPPIMDALQTAAGQCPHLTPQELVEEWVRQYVSVSFLPLLWMFTNHGISMEAHVQNSMITIQKGWPTHFYVRDLEGVSIGRTFAREQGMFGQTVTDESPVLYRDEEAWERFKYYVVVNHLGHLLHTLACYSGVEETALWSIVADEIQKSELIHNSAHPHYAQELIDNHWLPAKANLTSWFYQRGERPLYVNIPNPLTAFRREV
ncbi:IucA/IucC family protein [Brevibacillus dissolubilis]|uniref:IucA/IucC family protein n=1 Tax=Brevibacillus dissolubilis TaxID=1844116 RepID=UPI001115D52A|nr:IucA/IucC family protein [Brevibacillus dissolubilis]